MQACAGVLTSDKLATHATGRYRLLPRTRAYYTASVASGSVITGANCVASAVASAKSGPRPLGLCLLRPHERAGHHQEWNGAQPGPAATGSSSLRRQTVVLNQGPTNGNLLIYHLPPERNPSASRAATARPASAGPGGGAFIDCSSMTARYGWVLHNTHRYQAQENKKKKSEK